MPKVKLAIGRVFNTGLEFIAYFRICKLSLGEFFDLEMLLEDGEMRTLGYKNLEMLLEDGETRTRGCKNLEIKNFMYPTQLQPFCEPAFPALHYPRPPCAPSFTNSRTLRILPTHFLHSTNTFLTFLKFLVCIHAGNPRVPPRVLVSGPKPWTKPCGGNKKSS